MMNNLSPFLIPALVIFLANPAIAQSADAASGSAFFQFIPILLIIGIILLAVKIFNKSNKNNIDPLSKAPEPRPWARHWARLLDVIIFGLVFGFVLGMIFPELANLPELAFSLLVTLIYVFVESLMLSQWGTTPGKELLNISITKESGDTNFTYSESLKRSLKVWAYGCGCGLPLITLITEIVSYKRLMRDKITSWDSEGGFKISHGKIGPIRIFIYVLILLFIIILLRFEEFAAIYHKN